MLINKIMKILKIKMRITKVMNILEIRLRIIKIIFFLKKQCENPDNQENLKIPYDNY